MNHYITWKLIFPFWRNFQDQSNSIAGRSLDLHVVNPSWISIWLPSPLSPWFLRAKVGVSDEHCRVWQKRINFQTYFDKGYVYILNKGKGFIFTKILSFLCHFQWYEVISHCYFSLHFLMMLTINIFFADHHMPLFKNVFVHIAPRFFDIIVCCHCVLNGVKNIASHTCYFFELGGECIRVFVCVCKYISP